MAADLDRVDRFWCQRDGEYALDDEGYLADPDAARPQQHPAVRSTARLLPFHALGLLGEPGAGKSTELGFLASAIQDGYSDDLVLHVDLADYGSEDRLVAECLRGDEIEGWRAGDGNLWLLLDGLDECQLSIPRVGTLVAKQMSSWPTDRLRLAIACRSALWPDACFDERLPADLKPEVFELLPLRRRDVAELANDAGFDGDKFLNRVAYGNAAALASRPQTLKLLFRTVDPDASDPLSASSLYRDAIPQLVGELNPDRLAAGQTGSLSTPERIAIAARLAAYTIFCGAHSFATAPADPNLPPTTLQPHEWGPGTEPVGPGGTVEFSDRAVREVLGTALFTSRGPGVSGWAHQSFAEYLAASYLASHDVSAERSENILVDSSVQPAGVYPQLRPVASWLVGLDPDRYSDLVALDPESFAISPIDLGSSELQAQALGALLTLAEDRFIARRSWQRSYSHLYFEGMAPVVREGTCDRARKDSARRFAIDVARDCLLVDLVPDLVALALDDTDDINLRVAAAHAAHALAEGTISDFRDLAINGDDVDDRDELKGVALACTWPDLVGTTEVFDALTRPKERSYYGSYKQFLQQSLPTSLCKADLLSALGWLARIETQGGSRELETLADAVVRLAVENLEEEGVVELLSEVVASRARRHESLLVDEIGPIGSAPNIEPVVIAAGRRELILATLTRLNDNTAISLVDFGVSGPALLGRSDFDWLMDTWEQAPQHRRSIEKVLRFTYDAESVTHRQRVLELNDSHPLRASVFWPLLGPVEIASPAADEMRASWRMHVEAAERLPNEPESASVDEIAAYLEGMLQRFEDGDTDAYWHMRQALLTDPTAGRWSETMAADISELPLWGLLSPRLRERLVDASLDYLKRGRCEPGRWLGKATNYWPAIAAYRAFILALTHRPSALVDLDAEIWNQWGPILYAFPWYSGGPDEVRRELLALALAEDASSMRDALLEALTIGEGRTPEFSRNAAEGIIDHDLAERLVRGVASGEFGRVSDVLQLLVPRGEAFTQELLVQLATNQLALGNQLQVEAIGHLLAQFPEDAWKSLGPYLKSDEVRSRDLLSSVAYGNHHESVPLPASDLGELFELVARLFPYADDPDGSGGAVSARQAVAWWRDALLRDLQRRATADCINVLVRLKTNFPDLWFLGEALRAALDEYRKAQLSTITPAELVDVVTDPAARLVRSEHDLVQALLDALGRIQVALTGETPESHLLWNSASPRKPKAEPEMSDYLKNELAKAFSRNPVVVNREVEVRRSRPSGVGERPDVKVEVLASRSGSTSDVIAVPIEVKGCWNDELEDGIEAQLADAYMADLRAACGLYVVFWFDVEDWQADEARRRTQAGRGTAEELHASLKALASDLEKRRRLSVHPVVLDASYGRPSAT